MKNIKVLGTGCAKCDMLYESVKKVADSLGLEYELEKINDIMKIMDFGVMMTPALVVDGEVKATGKIPNDGEIKEMIS